MTHQDQSEQRLIDELRQRIAELEKVSQEKESEAALILKVAPLGIHECDTDGRITFVNPCQERFTGYPADELVGTYIWDRMEPGPQKDSLPVYLKQLVSEQPPPAPFVARNIRKNGELYDIRVDWNYERNRQGQVTGFLCIITDVTEQKRAEVALQESEKRYCLLMESIPQAVWRADANGETSQWNNHWYVTGQTPEEARGFGWMKALHPDDVKGVIECMRAAGANEELYQAEYRVRQASDGGYRWHLAWADR